MIISWTYLASFSSMLMAFQSCKQFMDTWIVSWNLACGKLMLKIIAPQKNHLTTLILLKHIIPIWGSQIDHDINLFTPNRC